ncbi:NACHT and WD repeat domain-containing protein 2 isoform X2 [Lingula anatina]|uniref:NACHT and WD repeat domain-containing protein 2 isoform X1 n=1 Tax=Lingula anatina TaxID=7574 RepID=A0A1S3HJS8_LINAN|nr:NACHT and WD repeat domain-containing protein 2 isoform X1 [Lingula anatina]XP_013386373.1 NACHT and WD repeat domain-containing protein 2 isoform X2 [Lingula anatina]|eukprot:XP_013386372.1 NACHT and WD repeat domain-containing protein 2 isoform X1 [Lingula anatina]
MECGLISDGDAVFKERYYGVLPEPTSELSVDEKRALEEPFTYPELTANEKSKVAKLLTGNLPLDELPASPKQAVRVYMNAPLIDTIQERSALIQKIYSKLKSFCRDKHGVEFQMVDLNWGVLPPVRDNDHSMLDTYLREVQYCRSHSVGPSLVSILGQKYGDQQVPAWILTSDYKAILKLLEGAGKDVSLLHKWYWEDSNRQPPVYILQPVDEVSWRHTDLGIPAESWVDTEKKLLVLFNTALALYAKHLTSQSNETNGLLHQQFQNRLKFSVVEQEMRGGVADNDIADDNHRICYIRTIADLHKNLDKKRAYRYIDFKKGTKGLSNSATDATNKLKLLIRNNVNDKHLAEFTVKWSEPHGIDPADHAEYLEHFCNDFYYRMVKLIDANMDARQVMASDHVYEEAARHWRLAKERCGKFMGRTDELVHIREYLLRETNEPLVIHAPSGYGKTSLISKAAQEVNSYLQSHGRGIHALVVLRILGLTPRSRNLHQVLKTMCHQLAAGCGKYRYEIPDDVKSLKQYFRDFIQRGEFAGMIVLLLDGLNKLDPDDSALGLEWLPVKLPDNVKIIVTTTPDENGTLSRLRFMIPGPENFIDLKAMKPHLCNEIVQMLLKQATRGINDIQLKVINKAFRTYTAVMGITPLYIKLVFEEAVRWKFYTEVDLETLPKTIYGIFNHVLERLEKRHGQMIVSRCLGYITLSPDGLSEAELDDILSLDDDVLNSLYVTWEPPLRRFPTVHWVRVRQDLEGYLVERENDGVDLLTWHHKELADVVRERYLGHSDAECKMRNNLADFFLGKWSGTWKKPFKYEPPCTEGLKKTDPQSEAVRYVCDQPLIFNSLTIKPKFNYRKLTQLPVHLAECNRTEELKTEVLFHYEWIHAKLKATSFRQMLNDFHLIKDREAALVEEALRMSESALVVNPDSLSHQLLGRLLPHMHQYPLIKRLLNQCDLIAMTHGALVPRYQLYTTPGAPLQYICDIKKEISSESEMQAIDAQDAILLAAKRPSSNRMSIWNVTSGEPRPIMTLPQGKIHTTPDGRFFNILKSNRSIQTYKVDTGELYGEVQFSQAQVDYVTVSNKYVAFTVKQQRCPFVIDHQERKYIHTFDSQSQCVAISRNDQYIIFNADHDCLAFHEFPMLEQRRCAISVNDVPTKMVFAKEPTKVFVMFRGKSLKCYTVNLVKKNAVEKAVLGDLEMQDFKLSHTDKYILVRSSRCLFLLDANTCKQLFRFSDVPTGVFVESNSTFREAGFSPNDAYVVAIRHTYLCLWDTCTGTPKRLFQTSVLPITSMATSRCFAKVATWSEDHVLKVWDLNNLDTDVVHSNEIFEGTIFNFAVSTLGPNSKIVCCGTYSAEAKILGSDTGICERTVEHSNETHRRVTEVLVSRDGKFILTRADNVEDMNTADPDKAWTFLREDKVWDTASGQMIFRANNSRCALFTADSEAVVIIQCDTYTPDDPESRVYRALFLDLNSKEQQSFELPRAEIVSAPFVTSRSGRLAYLMQKVRHDIDAVTDEPFDIYETRLCIHSLSKFVHHPRLLALRDIVPGADRSFSLLDVRQTVEDNFFVVYRKDDAPFEYKNDGTLDRGRPVAKGALLFDVVHHKVLEKFDCFMEPSSDIQSTVYSRHYSIAVDQNLGVFDIRRGMKVHTLKMNPAADCRPRLLLDGKYVATLSENRRMLLVSRASDSVEKARAFIHGYAEAIHVSEDDRTVFVSTQDGRILSFLLILDTADPVIELISKVPSRAQSRPSRSLIYNDIQQASTKTFELHRLSVAYRHELREQIRRPPSYRTLETAVLVTQRNNTFKSQSCSIQ